MYISTCVYKWYVIYFNTTEKQQIETMWHKTQNKNQDQQIQSIILKNSVVPLAHVQWV